MTRLRVATYNLYLGADLALLFDVADLEHARRAGGAGPRPAGATRFEERAAALARSSRASAPTSSACRRCPAGPRRRTLRRRGAGARRLPAHAPRRPATRRAAPTTCTWSTGTSAARSRSATGWSACSASNVTLGAPRQPGRGRRGGHRDVRQQLRRGDGHRGRHLPGRARLGPGRRARRGAAAPVRQHPHRGVRRTGARRTARRAARPPADVEDPVVVVGDFNAGPEAVGMPPDWTDAWTRGEGDGFTCGQAAGPRQPDERAATSGSTTCGCATPDVTGARVVGADEVDRTTPHRLWPSDHAGGRRRTCRSAAGSVSRDRTAAQRLGLAAPLLAGQPTLLRAAGRSGRAPGPGGRRAGLGEQLGEPGAGGLPVAVLRAVLRRGDRHHAVDQPVRRAGQQPGSGSVGQRRGPPTSKSSSHP